MFAIHEAKSTWGVQVFIERIGFIKVYLMWPQKEFSAPIDLVLILDK